jgi:hypothetical protein
MEPARSSALLYSLMTPGIKKANPLSLSPQRAEREDSVAKAAVYRLTGIKPYDTALNRSKSYNRKNQ